MGVLTRKMWNDMLTEHNQLVAECEAGTEQPLAEEKHVWKKKDVRDLKESLLAICPSNAALFDAAFDDKLEAKGIWAQLIIDRLKDAIANGCCSNLCWAGEIIVRVFFSQNQETFGDVLVVVFGLTFQAEDIDDALAVAMEIGGPVAAEWVECNFAGAAVTNTVLFGSDLVQLDGEGDCDEESGQADLYSP
jgi:hypothetical protein